MLVDTYRTEEIGMKQVANQRYATPLEITRWSAGIVREEAWYAYDEVKSTVYVAAFSVFVRSTFDPWNPWRRVA